MSLSASGKGLKVRACRPDYVLKWVARVVINDRLLLTILYVIPVLLGFAVMHELADNQFYRFQLSDDSFYLQIAQQWADGLGIGPQPLYFSPLYPAFLALLAKLSITSVSAIRVVQVLLGSLSYPVAYVLSRRLFGRRAALFTYCMTLGYGVLLQGMTEMVSAWFEVLLTLGVALLLSGPLSTMAVVAAGSFTGLLCLGRPTFILFAIAVALLFALGRFSEHSNWGWQGARRSAVFIICVFIPVAPVTIRNALVGHDLVLVSAHGGINFYIGNSLGASGTFYAPPGFHEDMLSLNVKDAKRIAEQVVGRVLSASEISRFWFHQGVKFLLDNPWSGVELYGKKFLLLFHSYEVPSNSNYNVFKEHSFVLTLLPVSFSFLFVSALVGVGLSLPRWEKLHFLFILLTLHLGSVLIFFVASRFRLPMVGLMSVFAGHAFDVGCNVLLARKGKAIPLLGTCGVLIVLLSYPYPVIERLKREHTASSFDIMGTFYFENNMNTDEAEKMLRRAIAIQPSKRSSHWYLARILERRGDMDGAVREWDRASFLYGPASEWGRAAATNRDRLLARGSQIR